MPASERVNGRGVWVCKIRMLLPPRTAASVRTETAGASQIAWYLFTAFRAEFLSDFRKIFFRKNIHTIWQNSFSKFRLLTHDKTVTSNRKDYNLAKNRGFLIWANLEYPPFQFCENPHHWVTPVFSERVVEIFHPPPPERRWGVPVSSDRWGGCLPSMFSGRGRAYKGLASYFCPRKASGHPDEG